MYAYLTTKSCYCDRLNVHKNIQTTNKNEEEKY